MTSQASPRPAVAHRKLKAAVGLLVLLATFAAALWRAAAGPVQLTYSEARAHLADLEGVRGVLSVRFDGREYSGQQAARAVTVDLLADAEAPQEALERSMRAAAEALAGPVRIMSKCVITCHRGERDLSLGAPYLARGLWLSGEFLGAAAGWRTIRLPDRKRPPERALEGIYARPEVLACDGGRLRARVRLPFERRRRPAADIRELLAEPLLDTIDHDDVFERSPELDSLDLEVLDEDGTAAEMHLARGLYEEKDVPALRAELERAVLDVSHREMLLASKYYLTGLFTPLLFDAEVSPEDKQAVLRLEKERAAAEDAFYEALFSGASVDFQRRRGDRASGSSSALDRESGSSSPLDRESGSSSPLDHESGSSSGEGPASPTAAEGSRPPSGGR